MSSQLLGYLPASRGTLLMLRRKLELIRRGKNILEMRRDQLVREIFLLIDKLKKRANIEKKFVEALDSLAILRIYRGEQEFRSMLELVKPPEIEVLLVSVQGVPVPQARVKKEPDFSLIKDPEYYMAFTRLWEAVKELIEISNIEVVVERLTAQLSYINRVVNSIEKKLIPSFRETIRYIEEKLEEEVLGEYIRLMKIREE
ncbi:MAG: hypothetical protein DRJ38_09295 [Thermoprotei archaeon]|nr:MAG: hypothetical protein DRJ38_09295 [Thermoprotei archaeon]